MLGPATMYPRDTFSFLESYPSDLIKIAGQFHQALYWSSLGLSCFTSYLSFLIPTGGTGGGTCRQHGGAWHREEDGDYTSAQ